MQNSSSSESLDSITSCLFRGLVAAAAFEPRPSPSEPIKSLAKSIPRRAQTSRSKTIARRPWIKNNDLKNSVLARPSDINPNPNPTKKTRDKKRRGKKERKENPGRRGHRARGRPFRVGIPRDGTSRGSPGLRERDGGGGAVGWRRWRVGFRGSRGDLDLGEGLREADGLAWPAASRVRRPGGAGLRIKTGDGEGAI